MEIELRTPCKQGVGSNPYQVGHKPSDTLATPARASRSAPRGSNEDRGVSREVGCAINKSTRFFLFHLCCRDHWERLDRRSNLWYNLRNLRLWREYPLAKTTVCILDMRDE